MSNSVDNRVVAMKFDNSAFEGNVKTSMSTLDKLKAALNFGSSQKGLDDLQQSASRFNLGNMGSSVEGVSAKFVALSAIAITALANIANRAVDAGLSLVKSLTISPVMDGLREYETNINSIQTILSNTSKAGTTLDQVTSALDKLNTYSDLTIYNFSEMAKNIGTFTAAGVDLDSSVNAIKGIANLAALSGSNSQQASSAMYQLSQAMANNKVAAQDWISVVNANMGGDIFKEALYNTAQAMGTIKDNSGETFDEWIKNGHVFKDSLQDGWITGDVLANTLAGFTGDLSEAQLKAIGYTDEQILGIQKMGQMGQDAAQKVKTLTQLIDTAKETAGSGWAKTWKLVFGDFNEARSSFTDASNTVNSFLSSMSDARNAMLQQWRDLGGREVAIDILVKAFGSLMTILQPIKDAFREIFPPKTGQDLYNLTVLIRDFFAKARLGTETMDGLRRTAAGVFAAISIGIEVVKGILSVFGRLLGVIFSGTGGFLDFTGGIGDWLVKVNEAIKKGEGLNKFFERVGDVLVTPLELLARFRDFLFSLFDGLDRSDLKGLEDGMGRIGDRFGDWGSISEKFGRAWDKIVSIFNSAKEYLAPFTDEFVKGLQDIKTKISDVFAAGDFSQLMDLINAGLFGGILLLVRKFLKDGFGGMDLTGGVGEKLSGLFDGLTGNLKAMQTEIKADTLLKIAGALAILTVSVVALSLIDSDALTKALTAIAVGFGQLLLAMAVLTQISGSAGFLKIPLIAASMILLSIAIGLLVGSMYLLSRLDWDELAKGLVGVGSLLAILSVAVIPLSRNSAGMITAGLGITAIAVALNIMALAVKQFADMSWEEMAQGLVGVAGALLIIAAAVNLMPPTMAAQAVGVLIISGALLVLAEAVNQFSDMDWEAMGKGLTGVAGSLLAIAAAMQLMPKGLILQAVGLTIIASALIVMGEALKNFAEMSWAEMGQGIATLAASLLVLAGGLYLMQNTIGGAIALTIAAAALTLFVPVLQNLGKMAWQDIVRGLLAIAGVFAVVGIASILLGPATPFILAFGAALFLIGAGLALAGAGAFLFATAVTVLAAAGMAGIAVLTAGFIALLGLIPVAMTQIGLGLIAFAEVIATAGPAFVRAFTVLLLALLDAVIAVTPKIGEALSTLIATALKVLREAFPDLVETGYQLLLSLLHGLESHIGEIVATAANIIVTFLNELANHADDIAKAALNLVVSIIEAVIKAIAEQIGSFASAGYRFAKNLLDGIVNGLGNLGGAIKDKLLSLVSNAWDAVLGFFGINSPSKLAAEAGMYIMQGLGLGIDKNADIVSDSFAEMGDNAVGVLNKTVDKLSQAMDDVDWNAAPSITPVIDMTNVQKGVSQIDSFFGKKKIVGEVSYGQASDIETAQRDQSEPVDEVAGSNDNPTKTIVFNQTNNSPKALSNADIYRRTKNQLSVAKGS